MKLSNDMLLININMQLATLSNMHLNSNSNFIIIELLVLIPLLKNNNHFVDHMPKKFKMPKLQSNNFHRLPATDFIYKYQ